MKASSFETRLHSPKMTLARDDPPPCRIWLFYSFLNSIVLDADPFVHRWHFLSDDYGEI